MAYNSIIEKYKNTVVEEYGNLTLILYGSTVYGTRTSDLDICYISNKELSKGQYIKLKDITRKFHLDNNLRIDEEIPYDNKLVYSVEDVNKTFKEPPFPYINNRFIINPILKNESFLSSSEMSKRLLLNILTVRHNIVFGDEVQIKQFSDEAWNVMIRVVLSYAEKYEVTIEELINLLYRDPYSYATGELYLGYKDNLREKMEFLKLSVINSLRRLEEEQVVIKTLKNRYVFNGEWIKNGTKN